jgi:hypothetical protein
MLIAASVQHAAAQDVPATEAEGPRFRLGASVLYDTNISRSSSALAAARGLSSADEEYSVFANLNYTELFGSASAYLTGVVGYDFYQTNTILNREHIDLEAGVKPRFGNCQALLRGAYARHQSDLQDITQPLVTKNTVEVPLVAIDIHCLRDEGFSPYASVSQTWSFNSAPSVKSSNNRTFLVEAGVAYRQGSLGEIDLFGNYNSTDFPERLFIIGGTLHTDGYLVEGGGVRLSHTFGGRLQVSATVSYVSLNPHIPFEPSFDGFTYEGDVSYVFSPRLQAQFTVIRATNPSGQSNTSYSIDQSYALHATYKLNERLNLGVNARHMTQDFHGAFVIPGVNIQSQTINSISGYLSYDFSRNLALNLTAGDESRRADVAAFNYDSGRIGLSITAAF